MNLRKEPKAAKRKKQLTPLETEVLRQLGEGKTAKDVANDRGVTYHAIIATKLRIAEKLNDLETTKILVLLKQARASGAALGIVLALMIADNPANRIRPARRPKRAEVVQIRTEVNQVRYVG